MSDLINPNTIVSIFDDKLTLLEYLKACKPLYMHHVEINPLGSISGYMTAPVYANVMSSKRDELTIDEFANLVSHKNYVGVDDDCKLFAIWDVVKTDDKWKLNGFFTSLNENTGFIESFEFVLNDIVIADTIETL